MKHICSSKIKEDKKMKSTFEHLRGCGSGTTKCTLIIDNNANNIQIDYSKRWMGSPKKAFKITGKIMHELSPSYFIVEFNEQNQPTIDSDGKNSDHELSSSHNAVGVDEPNKTSIDSDGETSNNEKQYVPRCIYKLLLLRDPTPSETTAGMDDLAFASSCPVWNKTIDAILVHDTKYCRGDAKICNQFEELHLMTFEEKEKYTYVTREMGYLNFGYGGTPYQILFAYSNPCVISPSIEKYVSGLLLKGKKIPSEIYIDGKDKIYTEVPPIPNNYPDCPMVSQIDQYIVCGSDNDGLDTNSVVCVLKNIDLDKILLKKDEFVKIVKHASVTNLCDQSKKYPRLTDITIHEWNPTVVKNFVSEMPTQITILTNTFFDWVSPMNEVVKPMSVDDKVYTIKVRGAIPDCIFELGEIIVLKHKSKKSRQIITTHGENDCVIWMNKLE